VPRTRCFICRKSVINSYIHYDICSEKCFKRLKSARESAGIVEENPVMTKDKIAFVSNEKLIMMALCEILPKCVVSDELRKRLSTMPVI